MKEKNKGILVVSFGTTHKDTREKTLDAIESAIREEFTDYAVYRAYTSNVVMRRIEKQEKLYILNVEETILQMLEDGVDEIIIQPTHVIKGIEYEKIIREASKYKDKFKSFAICDPLLGSDLDCEQVSDIIIKETEEAGETDTFKHVFVFMGHGSEHSANESYTVLQNEINKRGYSNILIGTVEGEPEIQDIVDILEEHSYDTVTLIPLMIVAGDHAKNDMIGEDDDSWKSLLEQKGYKVDYILKGLGEIKEIQNMFIQHIKDKIE